MIVKKHNRRLLVATLISGIVVGGMGYTAVEQQQQIQILHEENMKIKQDLKNAVEKVETTTKELQKEKTIVSHLKEDNQNLHNENGALVQTLREEKAALLKEKSMSAKKEEWINFTSTAYISFCSEGCSGQTRTGIDVSQDIYYNGMRIIAVDPRIIPLYSVVELNDNGIIEKAIAMDTGGGIKGHHIDYLISTTNTSKALQYGKKTIKLRVVRWGKDGQKNEM